MPDRLAESDDGMRELPCVPAHLEGVAHDGHGCGGGPPLLQGTARVAPQDGATFAYGRNYSRIAFGMIEWRKEIGRDLEEQLIGG